MHQVRAVTLTGYLEVARSVGLDGARMLRQAGILPEWLEDPEHRLPASAVVTLIDRSAELSGCENFGLLMTERRSFASLGPVSLLLERLATPRDVVLEAAQFQRHLNDIVEIALEEDGDTYLIRLDIVPEFWSLQTFDHIVSMAFRILTGASGGRWRPDCVHLVRQEPADAGAWRRFYSAPVEFDATFNGLSCSAAAMQVPNPLADATMAAHARKLLHLVEIGSALESFNERVRRSIILLLPSGRATIDRVAAQLGLSPRSLQRRLDDEGHQFAELLNSVRRELATAYLSSSTHQITTVAALLGYASPSSFTRWFAGSFGIAPQVWRADHAANDDAARRRAVP